MTLACPSCGHRHNGIRRPVCVGCWLMNPPANRREYDDALLRLDQTANLIITTARAKIKTGKQDKKKVP